MNTNTALLIIDIQNDYFKGGRNELHEPEAAAARAAELLAFSRSRGMSVFHVQHVSLGDGASFFLPDTTGVKIHESVKPMTGEPVVVKHAPDSFFETSLRRHLQEAGIKHLVVCGMMTHMCVDTTVRAARNFGYSVSLIGDACATKDLRWEDEVVPAETVQRAFLASIDGSFAEVLPAAVWMKKNE